MRIYVNVIEAIEEIRRDLMEMGIEVRPKSMQDKNIEGNPDYYTKELQNYNYCILEPNPDKIPGVIKPWADEEFKERIEDVWDAEGPKFINPGEAYKLRPEIWNEYLHEGKFAYSYNERIYHNNQLNKLIKRLKKDPDSRQLWLSLWNPSIDPNNLGGLSRVPCSLGYNFQVREGKLNIHYIMRSCDFATHFPNDIYLAIRLLEYVAQKTNYEVGTFTHTIFSLHVYNKDIEGVF